MEKNTLVAMVLGVLVLIAAVSAFQLNGLRNTLSGGAIVSTVNTASQPSPIPQSAPSGGNPQIPSSLQNLPDMVGGC